MTSATRSPSQITASLTTQMAQAPLRLIEALRARGWLDAPPLGQPDYTLALALLLEKLGWQGDIRQLCDALPRAVDGLDFAETSDQARRFGMFDLMNAMAFLGYEYSKSRCTLGDIKDIMLPCVMQIQGRNTSRMVVLLSHSERGWLSRDLVSGEQSILTDKGLKGKLTIFRMRQTDESGAEHYARTKTGYTWFRTVSLRFMPLIWQVVGLGFLINMLALIVPIFVMVIYDRVIGARSLDTLPYLTVGVMIALTLEAVLRFVRLHALSWLGARITSIVSIAIFERLIFLPPAYTEHASVPAQLARMRAFEMLRDFFSGSIFLSLLELPFVIILLIAIALISGPLVWIAVSVSAVYLVMLLILRRHIVFNMHRTSRCMSERQQAAVETFTKLDSLKLCGLSDTMADRFSLASARASISQFRSQFIASSLEHASSALSMLTGVATLAFGVEYIWSGDMTVGALVATMILTWRTLNPLQTACAMLPRLEHVRNSIEQVNRLMTLGTEREPNRPAQSFAPFVGHIRMQSVGLRYSRNADPVFGALTLDIRPGQLVAVTGGNGAGKTSLLKLISGLYVPQSGTIRIDGTDTRQFDPLLMRRNMTYISQTPHIFSGSIYAYFALSIPAIDEAEVAQALKDAGIWEDISSLPAGLHTLVEDAMQQLSPALITSLNLARLYLQPQPIILCDEMPNNLLTGAAGSHLRRWMQSGRGRRTMVYVSHHRDFIGLADQVLYLQRERAPRIGTAMQAMQWMNEERV